MSDDYPPNLAASLALVQTRLPRIAKTEHAEVRSDKAKYSYNYAGLADISAQVLPLLGAVGLSFTSKPTFDDTGRYILKCTLLHHSGERDEGVYLLPTSGSPQALGSAITYGRRYLLCAMTGVAPEEDDDGAAAEAEKAGPRTAQRAEPTAERTPAKAKPKQQRARRPAPAEPPLPGEEPPADDGPKWLAELDAAKGDPEKLTELWHRAKEQRPGDMALARKIEAEGKRANTRTDEQSTKLHAQLGELGVTVRSEKLGILTKLARRNVESSSALTKAEASKVIETLELVTAADDPMNALDAVLAEAADGGDAE